MRSRGGEARAKSVESVNTQVLQDFLEKNLLQASVISTDEARFYRGVRGYHKLLVNHSIGEFAHIEWLLPVITSQGKVCFEASLHKVVKGNK